jgi:hypothetical protein
MVGAGVVMQCRYHITKFPDHPFKSNIIGKLHIYYMNRHFILYPPLYTMVAGRRSLEKACGRPQITRKKPVCKFAFKHHVTVP